jgi:hypothetical protein
VYQRGFHVHVQKVDRLDEAKRNIERVSVDVSVDVLVDVSVTVAVIPLHQVGF